MRKKFRPALLMFLSFAALAAACGPADESDPVDRELDLAMADDSLAAIDDQPVEDEPGQAEAPAETPPRRETPPAQPPRRTTPTSDPEPPAPSFRELSVSAGTLLRVSLDQELSTKTSNVGDVFTVTLLTPVTDASNVVIPAGTKIRGEVTALETSGSAGQQAMIRVDFGQLLLDGESYQVALTVTEANAVAVEMADLALVVATPDVLSLRSAKRLIKLWG